MRKGHVAEVGETLYRFDVDGTLLECRVDKAGPIMTRISSVAHPTLEAQDCRNVYLLALAGCAVTRGTYFRAEQLEEAQAAELAGRTITRDRWAAERWTGWQGTVEHLEAELAKVRAATIERGAR